MRRNKALIFCLLLTHLLSLSSLCWAWTGKVVGVTDGDTIKVLNEGKEVKIRLYGIDCPEKGQAFSRKAKQFTSDMVFGKEVEVKQMDTDRYGRTVAMMAIDKQFLNEELVKAGLAWVYPRYCNETICNVWHNIQIKAKMEKQGLWADPKPVAPWGYKRRKGK